MLAEELRAVGGALQTSAAVSSLEQQIFHLRSQLDNAKHTQKELKSTIQMKNNIIGRLKEENKALNSGNQAAYSVDDLLIKISTLEAEMESVTDRNEELERSQKSLMDKVKIYVEDNKALSAEVAAG
jgi:chromosome segregation ATPase